MYEKIGKNLEKKYKVSDYPLNLAVEVTNHCNLNCVMCNNDKLKRKKGFMTGETYRRIIDETVRENPNARIWLDFYGEAMLAGYKLYWMIDYAKKRGCTNVCINTNGTLMKPEYADFLIDSGVDYISLDCDGFSKEVYEGIRRGGNRDVFYSNVEYLLKEKYRRKSSVFIDIKVIDMEENHNEIENILNYWKERGANVAVRRCSVWVGENDKEENITRQNINIDRIACGHGIGTAAISWDGFLAGCVWDYDMSFSYGNIYENSIKEMWQTRNAEFLKKHMEHRWDELPEICKNCDNWMNVGEERYTPNGEAVERHYGGNEKIFD